jgi:hypothetical protein
MLWRSLVHLFQEGGLVTIICTWHFNIPLYHPIIPAVCSWYGTCNFHWLPFSWAHVCTMWPAKWVPRSLCIVGVCHRLT